MQVTQSEVMTPERFKSDCLSHSLDMLGSVREPGVVICIDVHEIEGDIALKYCTLFSIHISSDIIVVIVFYGPKNATGQRFLVLHLLLKGWELVAVTEKVIDIFFSFEEVNGGFFQLLRRDDLQGHVNGGAWPHIPRSIVVIVGYNELTDSRFRQYYLVVFVDVFFEVVVDIVRMQRENVHGYTMGIVI